MQARLKEESNDETAQNELSTLQNQKDTIDRNVEIAQKNYDRISRRHGLATTFLVEQTKHKTEISQKVANYGLTNNN